MFLKGELPTFHCNIKPQDDLIYNGKTQIAVIDYSGVPFLKLRSSKLQFVMKVEEGIVV
jgi:hypothetical protein